MSERVRLNLGMCEVATRESYQRWEDYFQYQCWRVRKLSEGPIALRYDRAVCMVVYKSDRGDTIIVTPDGKQRVTRQGEGW